MRCCLQIVPYRWRPTASFIAHAWKATTQQHHAGQASLIARYVPPEAVVFDIGAHAGQYTKLFARCATRGHVYAFEPGSYARSILRMAVWTRGLRNVTVVPVALGAVVGAQTLTIPLKRSRSLGFGLAHFGEADDRWSVVAQEVVATVTVDVMAAALRLERLDFIKADIEGWELQMLNGARAVLDRFHPLLLLELTQNSLARAGDRLDHAFGVLAELGYQPPLRLTGNGDLLPVEGPADGDFLFLHANHR